MSNSLTGQKTEFIPHSGRTVKWYGCGPTVYDAAHLGHARTYVGFDILRRIMGEYFGYDVKMVMNITDIDDKIIKRSQEGGGDFRELARHWEAEFWSDMAALNVMAPDVITRVSEYVDEVVGFIQKIIDNKYAYESSGSVYFDVAAFKSSGQHVYGRMEPWSINDQNRVLEGEGELGFVSHKRNPFDFALWKKAKPGEPSWPSPWGEGRPGWHIECSAMASEILGFPIDIHSGGIDLRFPHHDNELAQSEACFDKPQWVNYFLHTGHLNINHQKMSKSLKNFTTIKQALDDPLIRPRHIRILCLINRWDSEMNFTPGVEGMRQAIDIDTKFMKFFGFVNNFMRKTSLKDEQKWRPQEQKLADAIDQRINDVHMALCDNFNTPQAMLALQSIMSEVNTYINETSEGHIRIPLVQKAATFAFKMMKVFGVVVGDVEELNYDGGEAADDQKAIEPIVDCLANFRRHVHTSTHPSILRVDPSIQQTRLSAQKILKAASSAHNGVPPPAAAAAAGVSDTDGSVKDLAKGILCQCDSLRDEELPNLGIQLEDRPDGYIWNKVSKEQLLAERQRKQEEEDQKRKQKEEAARQLAQQRAKKEAEARVPTEQYYSTFKADEFSEFDGEGLPTLDAKGEPVSKSQRDKMRKFLVKHKKAHEEWLKSSGGGGGAASAAAAASANGNAPGPASSASAGS